ncbi:MULTISPECIES: AAA family ATPase [unclassified Variovorax]|jgi:ATP-dependent 26S proteasome regulatory subunit|uniref:AAA family ATPase n=1 Tax=unclassified Variovorax TaxID=663243 RepID=UPI000F7E7924|nr:MULTISPECIES: AAA family ATPase [unclassified Variovorax]RSZ45944.1 AAA family ATPase [Variovorax sp. 553]RSZ46602.1 AAA family ATPase [Variovorax sp. 679]
MSDTTEFKATLTRYLKARIPFISIRSAERARVLDLLREVGTTLNAPVYVHTLSQGTRELATGRSVNEDRSAAGAVDFASQQFAQRQNLSMVLTEVSDIEDDTASARHLLDVVMLAAEHSGVVVVITTKPVWGQLQRAGMSLTLSAPTEDEMFAIIRENLDAYRGHFPIEWDADDERRAAAILAGISRIEAENIIATLLANGRVTKADVVELMHAKDRIFADISGIERVNVRGTELNVGGLGGLKAWLDKERPLLTADLRQRGIRPPRGVLLVGVPGCGKSLSAKAIAANWSLPLYRLDLSTIHGQYLGQSESRLKDALATADHVSPCVLWIDEIEKGLAGAQGSGDGGTSTRLVGQFLYWLQEARSRVFVVATANDVSKLPPELLRRGRFDELFFVDLPTPQERREIIDIYTRRGLKQTPPEELMEELVGLSDGFAGSDLESAVREVVKEAYLNGDAAVTPDLFRSAFVNVVPLSKTAPEQIENIRAWGRERAVPASGQPIGAAQNLPRARRQVLG